MKSSSCAAWRLNRITVRVDRNRSLIRTVTDLPLAMLVTFTRLPRASRGWAAVKALLSNASPVAVRRPSFSVPQNDASPTSAVAGAPGPTSVEGCAATRFSTAGGADTDGWDRVFSSSGKGEGF